MSIEERYAQKMEREQKIQSAKDIREFNQLVDEINRIIPKITSIIKTSFPTNNKALLEIDGKGYLFWEVDMLYQRIGIISDGRLVRLAVGLYSFTKFVEVSHINSFHETDINLKKIQGIKVGLDRLLRDLTRQIKDEAELKNPQKIQQSQSPPKNGFKKFWDNFVNNT